ncbi:MAG: glutamyl-tRNA reductase [Candidatus Latescibacterota bacterium]|jgi:glutamyl-tRNA reductase
MRILTLGLNHHTAPVEVREKLAFPENDQPQALLRLIEDYGLSEAAILSTCNRSELYMAGDDESGIEQAQRFLADTRDVDAKQLQKHFYTLSGADAATHLFRVACGIDSLVLGESQILKQVRTALDTAQRNGSARLLLNELFQRSLRTGKRARSETDIGRGHLSVSTAAVELASQVFDQLENCHVLLLGAGEMSELTAQYLVDAEVASLRVANRTFARAEELARRFSGEAVDFEALAEHLAATDIVISSTSAPGFVVTPAMLTQAMKKRRGRPLFLIDIAVPRDVDPAARQIDNVFLFDMDDLHQVVSANKKGREREIDKVQVIIEDELRDFLHWFNALGAGPLIRDLRQHAAELQKVELERWSAKLNLLSEAERKLVENVLRGYGNKLLHEPLVQVRDFANADDGYVRLDTVRRLFGLDVQGEQEKEEND